MKIKKLYKYFTLLVVVLSSICNHAIAQSDALEVTATVVDEQGNAIEGVEVFGANGNKTTSDVNGQFKIKLLDDESILLEKKGYTSINITVADLTGSITMESSLFLASKDDEIKMGVATKYKRNIVGAVSSINTKDRLTYDNTQRVRDYINGLMLGVRGSDNIRGIGGVGDAIFVIDGVIGRDPDILNMEEVEQITVLKDANSVALYGSQGRNGVIVINTKRGKANKKEVNVNVRSGFRTPISLPNYLSSAAYMQLFNEAVANDGVPAAGFSAERIQNTRNGLNPFEFPDVDSYSSQFVQPLTTFTNAITEFSGGSDKNQYYVNVGWNREEAWVDINEDINPGINRFNVRGNLDFKINDWITSSLDGIAVISTNRGSRANLLNAGTTLLPNAYAPFLPVDLIDTSDPTLAGIVQAANTFDGFLLGTTQQFGSDAPIALAIAGGYRDIVFRSTQFNNNINFDLDRIAKGLSAKTYVSFDFFDSYNLSIENQFKTYEPIWDDGSIIGLNVFGEDLKDQRQETTTNGFLARFGVYGLINYDRTFANNHTLNTTLLGFYNSQRRNDVIQTDVDTHLGFQAAYDYKKKLFFDFTGNYINSIKLPEGNRGAFSPTAGIAYIISEESFLKDSKTINYLKLKASGGILKSDRGIRALNSNGTVDEDASDYYLYDVNYAFGNNVGWGDGNTNQRIDFRQAENLDLTFEERIDLNLGFETYLMNSLWIEANYFKTELDKQLTFLQDQFPSFYNTFRPYSNFDKNLFTGFEVGINFNKTYNDFSVALGANVLYSQTERVIRSEVFAEDYLQTQGQEISTIFGLVDQGFYAASDFDTDGNLNAGLPVPQFGDVQPGDIKYQDLNGDNIIDNDDRRGIGQSSSPWTYALNLNLNYKRFNLFVLGVGQSGAQGNKLNNSFNEYYSVDGADKYSEVVLGRWTPETASTATFPRLSAQSNQNNFRQSTFWLFDNSYFNINRAQLTYEFKDTFYKDLGIEDLSVNFSGTNLFEIGENRDVRRLRIGSAPLARSFTLGLRASF
ncbi:SusC/RagA family TonB-linked outer membrane protein [uncultured Winogradskyella sp.]|uniref:SusC/RagA family TonB-linked outer membrane protein n=1 Tax=uncultured Winogradskyella sp. TaxID=395353 RepID=UPI00261DCA6D|nr:SusC/RagA family TonB-linked outer membrane protein [uncultured Winogradskyella sp.]